MQPLTRISHEHHDRMWGYVRQLDELADCLDCDCLDNARLAEHLPGLRATVDGLVDVLIPHMETVEAAVYPTLERLLAGTTNPMVDEHREIRRLVAALGDFVDHPATHADRVAVLALRRTLLRLYGLLKAHLAEEEMFIPVLEDRLTPVEEGALARALDHIAAERL
jgi:Hemerythrin HHE cation binding domain